MDAKEIGKRVQVLRIAKGHTQQELAEELGLSMNMIAKVESGLRIPSIDTFVIMAEFFETSLDFIVLGK